MKNTSYTEKQLKIISGEIPLESITSNTARALYNKAVANGDTELAQRAKERLEASKLEAQDRNRQRANQRYQLIKEGKVEWKQPKTTEYTDHQKRVINGDIPLEQVHTNELIHIHQKAEAMGDIEVAETMMALILDRRYESCERVFARDRDDFFNPKRKTLTSWERGVINADICLADCSVEHLHHIYNIVKETEGPDVIKWVEKLLMYKEHPECVYKVHGHEAAIAAYEQLTGIKFPRPIKR